MKSKQKKYIPEKTQKPLRKIILLMAIILIVLLGLVIYSNSITGKFIWDDEILITNNTHIKSWSFLGKIFTEDIGKSAGRRSSSYRPLQMLTYMIDYSFWKLNEFGYHVTNILFHILVVLCIFWLVYILYEDWSLSLFSSLLFMVHPVHTEVVSYLSGRADSLATFFILLSLIFYIKQISGQSMKLYILMMLSYILALLSREGSIILPALVLIYHYAFKKKIDYRMFFGLLVITCLYVLLRFTALKNILVVEPVSSTLFQRLPGFFVAITNYIKLFLLPINLHMEYGAKLFNFTDPRALIGISVILASLIFAFRQRDKNRIVTFSILWFFITLLPVSHIYPINAYMAEHWLYLPSIGLFLIVAGGLTFLWRQKVLRLLSAFIAISLAMFYSYLTIKQNDYWKEPITFFERTLKYAAESPRLLNDLALSYRKLGKYDEEIVLYKKVIEMKPDFYETYINLAATYDNAGKYEDAIAAFKQVIEIKPDFDIAYNNLGFTYSKMGKYEEAINYYKKAIALNPQFDTAYINLGFAYSDLGKYEDAIASFKRILGFNPIDAYNNLGLTYITMGKNEEAIAALKKALEINPNYAVSCNNLAIAYYNEKQYDLAVKYCDKALELGYKSAPDFLKLLESLRKK